MNPDNSQLLAQLMDIHGAARPDWWPPAPGWWVMALLALVVAAIGVRALARRWKLVRRRRNWMQALDAIRRRHDPVEDPQGYLAGLNRLFRAVALRAFPETGCARLQGDRWVDFIAARLPGAGSDDHLAVLAHGPYEPTPQFDPAALESHARNWVKLHG